MPKKSKFQLWLSEFLEHKYRITLFFILLICSFIVQIIASRYVDTVQATPTGDLILNNIPTLNLGFVFIYGFLTILVCITGYTVLFRVKAIPYILWQFSLLILIRSFFMTLTHLGIHPEGIMPTNLPDFYQALHFQNDLFFSGHTAVPFLAYLIFRKEKIGKFFLVMTLIMAATVLFMHVHYSIDVFGAFFITFGTYHFGKWAHSKMPKPEGRVK